MSKHNILFFSSHREDLLSKKILDLLKLPRNKDLRDQFVIICVNSPGIKLPRMIMERNEVPVIICRGFNKPISGEAALKWIEEHNSDKAMGLEYGDPDKANQVSEDHGVLASESGHTSYHQAFNNDWNAGAENDTRTLNSAFSNIEETNSIDTVEERGKHNTRGLRRDLDRRLKQADNARLQEIPFPHNEQTQKIKGNDGPSLQYNPNPLGAPPRPPNPFEQPAGRSQFPPAPQNFNNLNRLMTPQQTVQQPRGQRTRDGVDFPPTPSPNPLFPSQQNRQPHNPNQRGFPGNLNAPKKGGRFPELPPGFGPGSNSFSTLDSAFTGQSLMGTPMHDRNSKFNDRREKSLGPGLPVGRGHAGPFNQMVNTSNF